MRPPEITIICSTMFEQCELVWGQFTAVVMLTGDTRLTAERVAQARE